MNNEKEPAKTESCRVGEDNHSKGSRSEAKGNGRLGGNKVREAPQASDDLGHFGHQGLVLL